jgi:hypothetical protein
LHRSRFDATQRGAYLLGFSECSPGVAGEDYAAFGVGPHDKHITSIDEDGVALAAIKALHARVRSLDTENV